MTIARGKNYDEGGTGACDTVYVDLRAMGDGDALGEGESQAVAAAGARAIGAVEAFEDMRDIRFADAGAEVLNGDGDGSVTMFDGGDHFARGMGILERIVEQADEQTMQGGAVAGDDGGGIAQCGFDADLTGLREAASGTELFYFEIPLANDGSH